MSAVRRLSGGRNKGCGGVRVLRRETTRGRVTTSEYIEVEVAGHRYFIEHVFPSERTQELWVVHTATRQMKSERDLHRCLKMQLAVFSSVAARKKSLKS